MRILWPEDVAAGIIGHFRHTLDTGEPYCSPRFTNPRHDVEIVESYEWELHRITLADGQYGVICYYYDSTKLREAEAAVRESERRYSALFANKINGMAHCRVITDDHGRPVDYWILQINEAYERIIGIKKADIEGRRVTEVFPEIQNYAFDYIGVYGKIALEGGEIKFEEFFEATGQHLSIYAYSPLPGEFAAIFTDVTERKAAEAALRESEEHYRSLFDNMLNGFAFCRMHFEENRPVDFTYLEVNRAFESLTGLKNVTGKRVSEVIPGLRAMNPEVFEVYGRVALTGRPEQFETYVEPMDMWFLISVYSPQKEHFVAVFDVITERKQAEEQLRETRDYLEKLFGYANAPIICWDRRRAITRFNPAFERLTGYAAGEVIGRDLSMLFPDETRDDSLAKIERADRTVGGCGNPHPAQGRRDSPCSLELGKRLCRRRHDGSGYHRTGPRHHRPQARGRGPVGVERDAGDPGGRADRGADHGQPGDGSLHVQRLARSARSPAARHRLYRTAGEKDRRRSGSGKPAVCARHFRGRAADGQADRRSADAVAGRPRGDGRNRGGPRATRGGGPRGVGSGRRPGGP